MRTEPAGQPDLAKIMRRRQMQQPRPPRPERTRRAVNPVRAPFGRGEGAVGKHYDMAATSRDAPQPQKPLQTFRPVEVIVAKDEPAPTRQAAQRILKTCVIACIGDEPQMREGL